MKLLKSKDRKIILTSKEYSQVNKLFKDAKKMSISCEPQLSELLKLSKNKSLWEKIKGSDRDIIRNLASSYNLIQKAMDKLKKFNIEENYMLEGEEGRVSKSKVFYFFKAYLYQNSNDYEPFKEYKKLESHFDWLIGDDFKGTYRNIKVINHLDLDDPVIEIKGEVSGVSEDEFYEVLIEGADENYNLNDGDIVEWKKAK